MAITYELVKSVSAALYDRSLRRIPEDARRAIAAAREIERNAVARQTLTTMLLSADRAEESHHFVCSDAGIPVYFVRIGTRLTLDGDLKKAITDGFDELTRTIDPPLLMHVTNPLTLERSYKGKDVPIVSFDLVGDADYVELICSPKALGSGRWAALRIFSFPSLETIEEYVLECVLEAGSQACPPVVVGVGIGGTFDYAAKLAKESILRPVGQPNPDPTLAAMEARLLEAINQTGFGPMGTGGDATAMAVHVDYSAGHGFTPVAVCFNCWINRRTRARIYDSGEVVWYE
jgi:fumarate hydratase subunit alpha